jgi:hypothetical protein
MQYVYWKWSKSNESYKKTLRKQVEERKQNKISSNLVDLTNKSKGDKMELNKRELCSDRISQREMHIQTNINPFIEKRNYVNDISTQDNFLRPLDSNIR